MRTAKSSYITKGASLIALLILVSSFGVTAQDNKLQKQVQVVRPYEPTISDAFKLNVLPQIDDTVRVVPIFKYNLTQRPVTMRFPIAPISPAKVTTEPLSRVNKVYIKAGFGNYVSPLAEIYVSNGRSDKYSLGASVRYNSSMADIKLDDDSMVDGTFHRISATANGKRIFRKSALAGDIDFNRHNYGFYGYDVVNAPSAIALTQQYQQKFDMGIKYYSTHSDSSHLNYNLAARYTNFTDKFSMQQNTFLLKTNFDRFLKVEKFGGTIQMVHHNNNATLSNTNNTIITLSPWIGLFGKQWTVQAGMGLSLSNKNYGTQTHFYPIAQLSVDIINSYIIPYFQFSGYLEDNSYAKVIDENPWVNPGLNVSNTSHKLIVKGGVKGNLSSKVAYNVSARYSLIDSAYFFVNPLDPTRTYFENRFDVVYDNIQKRTIMGELTVAPTNSLKFYFYGEYNIYTMKDIDAPWHKPALITRSQINYSYKDNFSVFATLFAEGNRPVRVKNGAIENIDGIIDLNIGGEHRFNKRISVFLSLNNITAKRYNLWYLYPAQQFNMRGGLTYNF